MATAAELATDPFLSEEFLTDPAAALARVRENLERQEFACMLDALLDVLPCGAQLLEDRIDWVRFALFSRMDSLPVDVPWPAA